MKYLVTVYNKLKISTLLKTIIPFFILFISSCVSKQSLVKKEKEYSQIEVLRELKNPNGITLPEQNNYYKIPCFLYEKIDSKDLVDIYPPNGIDINKK